MTTIVLRDEQGSATTEMVLVVPVLLVLLGLVVMGGRIGEVRGAVLHAAQQAARAASLEAGAAAAHVRARDTAMANLDAQAVLCVDLSVDVDTSRFERGGDVGVTVSCALDLSSVAFGGLPGRRTVEGHAVEPIDVFRGGP